MSSYLQSVTLSHRQRSSQKEIERRVEKLKTLRLTRLETLHTEEQRRLAAAAALAAAAEEAKIERIKKRAAKPKLAKTVRVVSLFRIHTITFLFVLIDSARY